MPAAPCCRCKCDETTPSRRLGCQMLSCIQQVTLKKKLGSLPKSRSHRIYRNMSFLKGHIKLWIPQQFLWLGINVSSFVLASTFSTQKKEQYSKHGLPCSWILMIVPNNTVYCILVCIVPEFLINQLRFSH